MLHSPLTKKLFHSSHAESALKNLLLRRLSQNLPMTMLSKVHLCEALLYICPKAVILTFVYAAAVVKPVLASANAGVKDSGHGGARVDEQVTGGRSTFTRNPPVEVDTGPTHVITVCDIALVSCRTGATDRDAVCGLLTECLKDVSFVTFMLHLLVTYYLISNFCLFLN
jgi:hypothetical protein